ncbi:HPr family phosphocarrier protein [Alkalibacillus haloalkaliphilus]|uniref:HPr family phosphocarrier protein n=1 Tax=Alkalibacillus haloalkaliphilus TaxID=94136 RepID=UPI0002EC96AD|nr:HPr family phosphocarrier protein [Alkalibacillus haloalkaliphilus]
MKQVEVQIQNETGLHARPAQQFVQEASKYSSDIKIVTGDKETEAKSILGIMTLGVEKGTTIGIKAEGDDEEEAVNALVQLVDSNFEG